MKQLSAEIISTNRPRSLHCYAPGIMACLLIAMSASLLSTNYGGPVMLLALLLGITMNFSTESDGPCIAGIEFCSKTILRFGIALLGMRISFSELAELGIKPLLLIISMVGLVIFVGITLARLMGLSKNIGILTGCAVAICGASAAMAVSAALVKDDNSSRDTLFTVVSVTALSTLAMILYPIIVAISGLNDFLGGVFLGATIHDVAQVVGAGYMVSEQTGDIATLVKLMRVAMLMPVVFVLTVLLRKSGSTDGKQAPVPFFLLGFISTMLVNNLVPLDDLIRQAFIDLSRWCLIIAIAALGMKTSLKKLAQVGGKAISLVVLETIFLALTVLLIVKFIL